MLIRKIQLKNFRNYSEITLNPDSNINYLYGRNGQGKTNLVESVFLCSTGKSHRALKDNEMIYKGRDFFYINIEFEKNGTEHTFEIQKKEKERKGVKIDGLPERKSSNIIGLINSVMFSPEDLKIIKGGPSERRLYFDIMLSQINPTYLSSLKSFNKTLEQRGKILTDLKYNNYKYNDIIEDWDNTLSIYAAEIIKKRAELTNELNNILNQKCLRLTDSKEELKIIYKCNLFPELQRYDNIIETANVYKKVMQNCLKSDIIREVTLRGPHRDEWEVTLNDMNIKIFGSQGQQRTAALALKLSEIDIYENRKGEKPIILLDDIMSELDEYRRRAINDIMDNSQTFFTGTDKKYLTKNKIKYFFIKEGKIIEE